MDKFRYKYEKYLPVYKNGGFMEKEDFLGSLYKIYDRQELAPKSGIPLYRGMGCTYTDADEDHYIVFGSTASKKSRNIAMPTIEMLTYARESMIISDSKGELYKRHSRGLELKGYHVIALDFKNMRADKWNPMEYIYDLYEAGDTDGALSAIADFAEVITEPSKKTTNDIYWALMAESKLQGYMDMMLHMCTGEEYNIRTLTEFLSEKNENAVEFLTKCMPSNATAYNNIRKVDDLPPRTHVTVNSTVHGIIKMFLLNNRLMDMLSESSFDIKGIDERPTAIFMIVPDNKDTMNGLIGLFVSQLSQILIAKADSVLEGRLGRRINWILDEFGNISKIPGFSSMITAARSRNIRYIMFVQSMKQIETKYEDADNIIANCSKIFLHSNEVTTLEQISAICGSKIIDNKEYPLISVSELQQLSKEKGEALVLKNRCKPYMTRLTDIDDYPSFRFEFRDIPSLRRRKRRETDIMDMIHEIMENKRSFYSRKTSKEICKHEELLEILTNGSGRWDNYD